MALTSLAFLLAYVSGLVMCVVRGPVWGLYTYIAAFYLHPPSRWWGDLLPDLRWALLAALVTLLRLLAQDKEPRTPFASHKLTWIFALYVVWMWIQAPFVISAEHVDGAVLFTKYMILLFLIYKIVNSESRVRDFLFAHVVGCFYLGWLAFNIGGGGRLEGVGGPGIDDSNSMAMHLGTGVVVGAMLLMTEKGWRFWLVLAALPFVLNGMILANSRGAFVGLVAGGIVLFWLKPPAFRKQFIAFGVLGVALLAYLANDLFWERISTLRAVAEEPAQIDNSSRIRLVLVEAQFQMFLDHPLGVGHKGTAALSRQYLAPEYLAMDSSGQRVGRSSHNTFMSVLVDQGIVGVCLLVVLLVWVWTAVGAITRRSRADPNLWGYGTAVAAGLTVAVVAGQFAPYLKAEVQYWFLALLMSLRCLVQPMKPVPVSSTALCKLTPRKLT